MNSLYIVVSHNPVIPVKKEVRDLIPMNKRRFITKNTVNKKGEHSL